MRSVASIKVLGAQMWDPALDNVDVEVTLDSGMRLAATFFTLQNVERIFRKNAATGECQAGLYLWSSNMILVRILTEEVIARTVQDLLESGELERAFCPLTDRAE